MKRFENYYYTGTYIYLLFRFAWILRCTVILADFQAISQHERVYQHLINIL